MNNANTTQTSSKGDSMESRKTFRVYFTKTLTSGFCEGLEIRDTLSSFCTWELAQKWIDGMKAKSGKGLFVLDHAHIEAVH